MSSSSCSLSQSASSSSKEEWVYSFSLQHSIMMVSATNRKITSTRASNNSAPRPLVDGQRFGKRTVNARGQGNCRSLLVCMGFQSKGKDHRRLHQLNSLKTLVSVENTRKNVWI